jgi:hypothetical protein
MRTALFLYISPGVLNNVTGALQDAWQERFPGGIFLPWQARSSGAHGDRQGSLRGWRFPEDGGGILGDLDEFSCDDSVEPDKVGKHLFGVLILHMDRSRVLEYNAWESV